MISERLYLDLRKLIRVFCAASAGVFADFFFASGFSCIWNWVVFESMAENV